MSHPHMPLLAALGDRYEFSKELGAGGMGTVYLARDRKHDRRVAIKAIRPDLTNEGMRRRFQREIKITARLQHPHILPLLDSGLAENILYYIMPYVEGESLEQRLERDRTLPPEQVWIGRDVARGLDAAHQKHVVHRDIKPGNIMLLPDHALILDFGIAKALASSGDNLVTAGGWLGTPAYMAPEQFHGHATPRSDIFALAAVLYEALTGRMWPFGAKRTDPDWTGVDPGLQRILTRALREQPGDRWPTAGAFAEALEKWDRSRGVPAETPRSEGVVAALRRVRAKLARRPISRPTGKSIAVLPLRNLNRDEETEYFSDGITEDIIAQLSKVRDLRVISMTSVLRYKSREDSSGEIGRALNVSTILEGSVRRSGNRVRIVSQLVDADTEEQLWAETYDRELTDIFALQSEVARRIAASLDARLSTGEERRLSVGLTENLAAYDLYLRSRVEWNRRTEMSLKKSVEYLEDAVQADPSFGLAHAGLASSHVTLGIYGVADPHEVMPRAREAAEESLKIDTDQVEAISALASVQSLYDWDWETAEAGYRRALQLGPNYAVAHQWYATHVLMPRGRFDSARYELDKAHELDPLAPSIATSVALLDYYQAEFERAEKAFRNVIEGSPNFWLAHYFLGWSLLELERNGDAIASLEAANRLAGESVSGMAGLAFAYARSGREPEARAILAELLSLSADQYVSQLRVAQIYAGLGETEEAVAWLGSAFEGRDVGLAMLDVQRGLRPIEDHPRFKEIRADVMGSS